MKKPTGPKPNLKQTLEIIEKELAAGNYNRAETIAAHLRSAYPRRPEVNDILGTIVAAQGLYLVAYEYHKLALNSEPHDPTYIEHCAADLMQMGRVVEADAAWRRLAAIRPKSSLSMLALARLYYGLGSGQQALGYFDKALELSDDASRPGIELERMDCLVSMGRTRECLDIFERGFDAGRFYSKFVATYASLDRWRVDSTAYDMVLAELERPEVTDELRSLLFSCKARIEENSKLYDQAYDTLTRSKRYERAVADVPAFRLRTEQRIEAVSAPFLQRLHDAGGHPAEGKVFVIGMPRSGTTLVEQIIGSHSQAAGVGELETMAYLSAKLLGAHPATDLQKAVTELGTEGVARIADEYLQVTEFLAPRKAVTVDKMPHNFTRAGEISILLPKAKFVHCIRNVADTFISAFQNNMNRSHAYSYDRDTYGDYYETYLRLMRHWYGALPGQIFTVEYEKLVTSPEPVIRSLLAFLGLPFEEACLNPQDQSAVVKTFSRLQVRSAINPGSVGRWRNYETQLAPLAARFANEPPFPPVS